MTEPVQPKLAATVVVLRSGRHGLEALLTKRPSSMVFAPNMHVFPGGRVDDEDRDPSLLRRSTLDPENAARSLGGDLEPADALATYIAATRELFEEAGILLAEVGGRPVPVRVLGAARSALVGGESQFPAIVDELELSLRTDLLVPLSRWVTPPTLPRRFDARFFAAALPEDGRVSFEGDEVADHAWLAPAEALEAMWRGEIGMWLPTSATLQQLQHATSIVEIRERMTPGTLGEILVDQLADGITRIVMPAGGGVAGQPVNAYLVGHKAHVLIDPGDPTGPALERALGVAASQGGSIEAIALTHADPDHAGGTEALAGILGVPVFVGPGGERHLPYAVSELGDGQSLPGSDVPIRAYHSPGPAAEHIAFLVEPGEPAPFVIAGDLDGRRGARSIVGPEDGVATTASRERIAAIAPSTQWLSGHPGQA